MIYVAIGRRLFKSIEESYAALRSGVLDDFGGCETRLITTDEVIAEIYQTTTPEKLLRVLLKRPYIMCDDEMAKAFQEHGQGMLQ